MVTKPLIGITVDCTRDVENFRTGGMLELNWNYAQAVTDAGGLPVLIPPMADMDDFANLIDGWIIPGGLDIDAKEFGQENHEKAKLQDPHRFAGERRLYSAIPEELPVLGICYGCQFLNVVRGGDLIQHVPDVVGNEGHSGGSLQEYAIDQESHLADIVGTNHMTGKSYHHQSVNVHGENLRVVSKHIDGTVEAVEATDRPWMIGVQWHPERSPDDTANQLLFKRLIEAAAAYKQKKAGA